ncbi:transmembrane protein, putative (macronuclear) [Tetrahymena thermophila SB210]|uniref:Transmembrane protein, putative n=1 Tax=Tetrahymena thermophila (strain SB210) TaxID=312017 RepID=Q23AC1_TETTS|nr:transmembrane protein, putative [Tetrahymena thermophila SB210]EAR93571.1 transmembrane protein, putative [Tetrahymena thermophila SB210]|eukprot:XP_001013816.1 transmembrane protein, putative [Tetrahymena thermophila SB210]
MNPYQFVLLSFSRILNKPINYLSGHLINYLNNHHNLRKKVTYLGKVVIHNEEQNIIDKAQRKAFKKYYSCNSKHLHKGAQSCIELGIVIAIGIIPAYIYLKKLFSKNHTRMDEEIEIAENILKDIDQKLNKQIESSKNLISIQQQMQKSIIQYDLLQSCIQKNQK